MPQAAFCYSESYLDVLLRWQSDSLLGPKIDPKDVVTVYVCLYRKKDGEAWRVLQAHTVGHKPVGTPITYRDKGLRDFGAKVISEVEYETFKIFEKIGKE